jgi:hypothetical protein
MKFDLMIISQLNLESSEKNNVQTKHQLNSRKSDSHLHR